MSGLPGETTEPELATASTQPEAPGLAQDPQSQAPQPPKPALSPQDLPILRDRFRRLRTAWADAAAKPVTDTLGRIVTPGYTPEEIQNNFPHALANWVRIRTRQQRAEMVDYLTGKTDKLPDMLLPNRDPVMAEEDVAREASLKSSEEYRKQHPVLSTLHDWLLEPAANIALAVPQAGVDVATGATNLLLSGVNRVTGSNMQVPVLQVKNALVSAMTGFSYRDVGRVEEAMRETAPLSSLLPQAVGDLVSFARGFAAVSGAAMRWMGNESAAAQSKSWLDHAAKVAARLGLYEFVTASKSDQQGGVVSGDLGERTRAAAFGALAGAVGSASGAVARSAVQNLLLREVAKRSADPKFAATAADAFERWAQKAKIKPLDNESAKAFFDRCVDGWVRAGTPGVKLGANGALAKGIQAGAEAVGLSALDGHFRADVAAAVVDQDAEAFQRAFTRLAGNFLGLAGYSMALDQIPRFQRAQRRGAAQGGQDPGARPQEPGNPQIEMQGPERPQQPSGPAELPGDPADATPKALPDPAIHEGEVRERALRDVFEKNQGTLRHIRNMEEVARGQAEAAAQQQAKVEQLRNQMLRDLFWHNLEPNRRAAITEAEKARQQAEQANRELEAKGDRLRAEEAAREARAAERRATKESYIQGLDPQFAKEEAKRKAAGQSPETSKRQEVEERLAAQEIEANWMRAMGPRHQDIIRLGWEPTKPKVEPDLSAVDTEPLTDEGGLRMQVRGTDYYFDVTGDMAQPSQALRKMFDLPESMPTDTLAELLERASLVSALQAKALLPGTEISADGIYADQKPGDEKPVMRTIRLGEILEAPLGPDPEWKPLEGELPVRGKDPISEDQQMVAASMRQVLDRKDLPAHTKQLVDASITVLDTVAASKNPSVGEALSFAHDALFGLVNGSPEHADRVAKVLAEMLTTKAPDVALDDLIAEQKSIMTPEQLRAQELEEAKRSENAAEVAPKPKNQTLDSLQAEYDKAKSALDAIGPEPYQPKKRGSNPTEEDAKAFDEAQKRYRSWRNKYLRLKKAEVDASNRLFYAKKAEQQQIEQRSQELADMYAQQGNMGLSKEFADAIAAKDVAAMRALIRQHGEAFMGSGGVDPRALSRGAGQLLSWVTDNKLARWVSEPLMTELDRVAPDTAKRFRNVETFQRENFAQLDPLLKKLANVANKSLPELQAPARVVRRDNGEPWYSFSRFHVERESDLEGMATEPLLDLPSDAKKAIELHDAITRKIREMAAELGVELRNVTGPDGQRVRISAKTDRDVLTRQLRPEMRAALFHHDPLGQALVEAIADANGLSVPQVEQSLAQEGWTEARGVRRNDAIETARRLKFMPDMIWHEGKPHRVLEIRPLRHAESMVRAAAMRLGVIREFGQDLGQSSMPADQQEAEAWEPYVPELPTPYLGVIEQHARPVRDLVARAFRAAHGMMLERAEVDPSGNTGRAVAYVSAFTDMAAALKMTMSWASNVLEPLGTASAYLGYGRVMPNLGRTLRDLVTGRLADQVEALIKEPGFRVHIPDWMQGNEIDTLEKFQAVTRKVANVALIPFELSQTIADISIFRAIQEWVRDMRDGRGSVAELPLLRRLGFSREEAEDMLRGYGSEQDYKAAAANALTRITRRGDLPLNRSRSESSKALKYFARFLKFFQAQMANLNQHVKDLREAESLDDARAAWVGLLKFVGANTLASLLTQATVTAIRDGEAGIVRMFGNMMDSPVKTFALTALSSIFGPWKAMVGGGLLGLFGGDDAQRGEAVRDLLAPAVGVTTAVDTLEMLAAVAHRAAGAPLDSRGFAGRYSGMGPVQMIGAYAGRTAPLAGTVLNGLAGVAPNYLGTDTELEQALKTARDFDRRNHVPSTSGTGAREDEPDAETSGAKFRDQMRAVAIRLRQREKPDLAALAHEIRSELPGKDDSAIAASLLARRVLAGSAWSRLSADQQKRKLRVLGPDQTEVLRGHDALLEALSYQFRPVR